MKLLLNLFHSCFLCFDEMLRVVRALPRSPAALPCRPWMYKLLPLQVETQPAQKKSLTYQPSASWNCGNMDARYSWNDSENVQFLATWSMGGSSIVIYSQQLEDLGFIELEWVNDLWIGDSGLLVLSYLSQHVSDMADLGRSCRKPDREFESLRVYVLFLPALHVIEWILSEASCLRNQSFPWSQLEYWFHLKMTN